MKAYKITVTMPDGSQGVHEGLYADSISATMSTTENFPEASRIEVVGLQTARAAQMCAQQNRLARMAACAKLQGQGERA